MPEKDARPRVLKLRHTGSPCVGGGSGPMTGIDCRYTLATGQDQTLFQPMSDDGRDKREQLCNSPVDIDPNDWIVRGLTPLECERLQGFEDGHTDITGCDPEEILSRIPLPEDEKKRKQVERNVRKWCGGCPDGPRYKACGNSMAVPVIQWLGERIEMVDGLVVELMMEGEL